MQIKKIIHIITIIILASLLTSCYDSTEVDDMVYVLAIGIDENDEQNTVYTFQTALPLNISSGVETGFAESEENITVQNIVVTAENIFEAIDAANRKLAKRINVSHCKLILFSESSGSKTLKDNIININQNNKFSPDTLVAICVGDALSYLDSISSPFEKNPARYYDMFFKKDFSLSALNTKISEFDKKHIIALPLIDKNGTSTSLIINNFEKALELSSIETIALNIITGNIERGYLNINNNATAEIYSAKTPKIHVDTNTQMPHFTIKLSITGRILTDNYANNIEEQAEKYIQNICLDLLVKTASKYNLDAADLIKFSRSSFITTGAYDKYNWSDKFRNSRFKMVVDFHTIK